MEFICIVDRVKQDPDLGRTGQLRSSPNAARLAQCRQVHLNPQVSASISDWKHLLQLIALLLVHQVMTWQQGHDSDNMRALCVSIGTGTLLQHNDFFCCELLSVYHAEQCGLQVLSANSHSSQSGFPNTVAQELDSSCVTVLRKPL